MSSVKSITQEELYNRLHSVISREIAAGLCSYERLSWQKFWNTDLRKISELKELNYNTDTDLIEITSLFVVVALLNEVHKRPDRFMSASQVPGSEGEVKNLTGRQSWDGFIVDRGQSQPITIPVEQKTNFYSLDKKLSGELWQEFDIFLRDVKSRDKLKGEKCFWIFNISPEVAAGKPRRLQLDNILNSIHNAKDNIVVGAVCFYELTDSQTISIYCLLFPDKNKIAQLNIHNIHEYMRIVRFKNKNIPQLRFPEFTDEWQTKKLGDILSVGSGRDYKHLNSGDVPVYGTGGLMTHVDEYLYDGKSVAIGRKGTIDQPQFLDGKFWTVDTLFYTHNYQESVPEFVYAIFQNINWKKWNEASGVPSLSSSTIKSIKVSLPQKPEQQKIANFLGVVDSKMTSTQTKVAAMHEYKKGVMQALFSGKLRFKDENDNPYPDWKERRLREVAYKENSTVSANDINGQSGEYKVFGASGFLQTLNRYDQEDEYIAIVKDGAGVGRLGIYEPRSSVLGTLNIIKAKEGVNTRYLFALLHTINFKKYSIGSTIPHVYFKDYSKERFHIACYEEQQKIADFLSALDDKIKLEEAKLASTKEFKKALLQRMFV